MNTYRQIIERVLTEYTQIPYAYDDIQSQTIFDRTGDHYLLMNITPQTIPEIADWFQKLGQ